MPHACIEILDDASDDAFSQTVLNECTQLGVTVIRSIQRRGKSANLLDGFKRSQARKSAVFVVDSDLLVSSETFIAMHFSLAQNDLVVSGVEAVNTPRTIVERAGIFCSRLQGDLRKRFHHRRPAFSVVGRCFAVSLPALSAILNSNIPAHTEDAHFAMVVLTNGLKICYLPDQRVQYRAPATLADHMRQSDRFADGWHLLLREWDAKLLHESLMPSFAEILSSFIRVAWKDLLGALLYVCITAVTIVHRKKRAVSEQGAWLVSESTKQLS